jgi:cytochrome c-type protein NapC/trimethylamine-N-oxide reductase cytochrome c-type subunit TorC
MAMLCFVGLNVGMKPVSNSEYCGGKCHEMNTAYQTWELSSHGANKYGFRVECVDCHLPPKEKYFRHLVAKGYEGGKDVYKHYLGGKYDAVEARKRALKKVPNDRCLHCHDDLLAKPDSPAARTAHAEVLNPPKDARPKCLDCHEDAGHERENTLFSQ